MCFPVTPADREDRAGTPDSPSSTNTTVGYSASSASLNDADRPAPAKVDRAIKGIIAAIEDGHLPARNEGAHDKPSADVLDPGLYGASVGDDWGQLMGIAIEELEPDPDVSRASETESGMPWRPAVEVIAGSW